MQVPTHKHKIAIPCFLVFLFVVIALGSSLSLVRSALAQKKHSVPVKQDQRGTKGKAAGAAEPAQEEEPDRSRERDLWFYEQRAYPNRNIPAAALQRARSRAEDMRRAQQERFAKNQAIGIEALIQASSTTWTPVGPRGTSSLRFGMTSGRVSALAVDPTDPNIVYLGAAQGGVWKSTNGGLNWTPLTDDQPSLAIGSIAIDPSSCSPAPCRTIYAGTGELNFSQDSYYGAGILKSTDGGATWTRLGQSVFIGPFSSGFSAGAGARIGSLAVNSNGVVLAGVLFNPGGGVGNFSGIYQSKDGGQTWANVLPGAAGTEVFFHTGNPTIAYAALGSPKGDPNNGVYKSVQSGDANTWTRADVSGINKLPTTNVGRIEITIAPSQPSTLYAAVQDATTNNLLGFIRNTDGSVSHDGFFVSVDGGANWSLLPNTPNFCEGHCDSNLVVRVHPNNPNVVYAGGSRGTCPVPLTLAGACPVTLKNYLVRSTDGGITWNEIIDTTAANPSTVVHWDEQSMSIGASPTATRFYLGNGGGVWSTDISSATGSVTWADLNSDLQIAQLYPGLSIHPSDDQRGFAGSQDNGTQLFNGALRWDQVACNHGGYTAIDPIVPSTVYAACAGRSAEVRKSYRNGERGPGPPFVDSSWIGGLTRGIGKNEPVSFVPPLVLDPNVPGRLYFGTNKIYQTVDGGDNWVALGALPGATGTANAIAPAPSDSQTVYAGTNTGLLYRTDTANDFAHAVWTALSTFGLPRRTLTSLVVHPTNKDIAYVCFSGFYADPNSNTGSNSQLDLLRHIFRSTTGGATWDDISGVGTGALPNTPVNAIIVDPSPASGAVGDTIFAGTDVGVFMTTDGGVNWAPVPAPGLPNVAVVGLSLRNVSRTLRAATHGRGAWDLQLPGLPAYVLTAVSPTNLAAGQSSAALSVRGRGFVPASSQIQWNGVAQGTVCTDTQNCRTTIPASLLASGVPAQVAVITPGAGLTNALLVTVQNPVPVLAAISPTSVAPNSSGQALTVTGSNFVINSRVQLDGTDLPTLYVSSTQLTAIVLPSTTQTPGVYEINVFNPAPGGGANVASQNLTFTVTGSSPPNDAFSTAIPVTFPVINGVPLPFVDNQNSGFATPNTGGVMDPVVPSSCATGLAAQNHSIWYKFTPTVGGEITADTFGSVYDTVLTVVTGAPGAFIVVACDNDLPDQFHTPSQVTFLAAANTTYYFMITDAAGIGGTTVFNLRFSPPPPNDYLTAAIAVSGTGASVDFRDSQDTSAATVEVTDPSPSCAASTPGVVNGGRARSVWYRYVPGAGGAVTADTLFSRYDTVLSVFTGSPGAFVEVACNDDVQPGNRRSSVTFSASANTTYFFMVSAFDGTGGQLVFHLTGPAPVPDFSASMSVNTVIVTRGTAPATATFTLTPANGSFSSPITFACQGLPLETSCSFNPTSTTLNSTPQSVALSITATPPSSQTSASVPPLTPWLPGLGAGALFAGFMMVRRRRVRLVHALAFLVGMAILFSLGSCAGGAPGVGTFNPGTPPGSYTVNVSATSGNFVRTATFTLTVQ